MKDAADNLGKILQPGEKRDAVHIALLPAVAGHMLRPGDHVSCIAGTASVGGTPVGIVDPYLDRNVRPGEHFYILLYPKTVTSLRHAWTHPMIPEEETLPSQVQYAASPIRSGPSKKEAGDWLANWLAKNDIPANVEQMALIAKDEIVEGVNYHHNGDTIVFLGRDCGAEIPPEFWWWMEVYLGEKLKDHPTYFSCSC